MSFVGYELSAARHSRLTVSDFTLIRRIDIYLNRLETYARRISTNSGESFQGL